MKKSVFFGGFLIAMLAITSCSKDKSEVNVFTKDVYGKNSEDEIVKAGSAKLLFKNQSEIPYISLDDGVGFMKRLRQANLDDTKYNVELKKENKKYVISNDTGAKCTIDKDSQTLTYDDFDKFTNVLPDYQKPLAITTLKKNQKAIKIVSSEYTKGHEVVVDLKPYSRLDVLEYDSCCYLPLSVFNSFLFNTSENVSIEYNNKDLFILPGNGLSIEGIGLTELGEAFRKNAKKDSISEEYNEYYYQSLCLDFNYQYGLKKEKFTSFEEFLKPQIDNILSKDPNKIDSGTLVRLSYLDDGHTTLSESSIYYGYGDINIDKKALNPVKEFGSEQLTKLQNDKGSVHITNGIEYKGDTAFVTFDEFSNINETILYNTVSESDTTEKNDDLTGLDDIPGFDFGLIDDLNMANTAFLFNKLYKELTSDTYKNTIKNVVVDLSTNTGGAADGLIYALSTLIGNVTFDMTNPLSGGYGHQVYMADINADGVVDSNDKPLCDLGFKIGFINSSHTFSSGNAMACIAKINKPSVVMLGEKTGGGPCAVRANVTPLGSIIYSSSLCTISKLENGKYVNIDQGVNADYTLTREQMIDRNYIVNNIKNWLK